MPAGWQAEEPARLPTHVEQLATGPGAYTGLLVQCMDGADPAADVGTWAEATVRLAGAPAISLMLAATPPQIVSWQRLDDPGLAARLEVDEAVSFAAELDPPGRVCAVAARRGSRAWHVSVSAEDAEAMLAGLRLTG